MIGSPHLLQGLFNLYMFLLNCRRFKKAILLMTTKIGDLRRAAYQTFHGKICISQLMLHIQLVFPLHHHETALNAKILEGRTREIPRIFSLAPTMPILTGFPLLLLFLIYPVVSVKPRRSDEASLPESTSPFADWTYPSISLRRCTCPFELRSEMPSCPLPAFLFPRQACPCA